MITKSINMKYLTAAVLLTFGTCVAALTPTPAPEQTAPVAIENVTIHIGNGERIDRGSLVFSDGKINAVGASVEIPAGATVIDGGGGHLYPGFVLPGSQLGLVEVGAVRATVDQSETGSLNPSIRSLIAYNTDSEYIPVTRYNGVLLAQTTPSGGMVSGRSSVVQLDAWNWEDAAVRVDDAVHVNWPQRISQRFDFATFTVKSEPNKNYQSQVDQITKLFADARAYAAEPGDGSNVKLAALGPVLAGDATLFLYADTPKDIVSAVNFSADMGIDQRVVVGTDGLLDAADFLLENAVPVIVAGTHRVPATDEAHIKAPYQLPAALLQAGLTVGLTEPSVMNARNLPFVAGTARAYGLSDEEAVKMISLTNAQLMGVGDRYGSLEVGKSATLFLSRGDALDMRGNDLSHAFIDGRMIQLDGRQQELYQRFHEKYSAAGE
ncbi:MAG: amidohydrolase [Lysobacteraceae bacterium]|nr:MAG: amidohydrolase [Xanthomonadaceae bacterium]